MSGRWAGSTRRDRFSPTWRVDRAFVLERDGYACQIRLPDRCVGMATDVDHIDRHGPDEPGNWQAACRPCHAKKSSDEGNRSQPRQQREAERNPGLL